MAALAEGKSIHFRQKEGQPLNLQSFFVGAPKEGQDVPVVNTIEARRANRILSDPPLNAELEVLWSAKMTGSAVLSTLRSFCRYAAEDFAKNVPDVCKKPASPP